MVNFSKKDHQSLNYAWECLVFALISEEFEDYNLIGLAISIRKNSNLIEIWLKDRQDDKKKFAIGEKIANYISIDGSHLSFQFKDHQSLLKDNSFVGSE